MTVGQSTNLSTIASTFPRFRALGRHSFSFAAPNVNKLATVYDGSGDGSLERRHRKALILSGKFPLFYLLPSKEREKNMREKEGKQFGSDFTVVCSHPTTQAT